VPQQHKLSIFTQGVVVFRATVVQHADVRPRMQRLLLAAVRTQRGGGTVDAMLVRSVLAMLVELGVGSMSAYAEDFERPMLEESAAFFSRDSRAALAASSAPDYVKYAERRLADERRRAELLMDASTAPKLSELLERTLVADHAVALVEMEGSGLLHLLELDRVDDLQRLHRLFAAVRAPVAWRPPPELATASGANAAAERSLLPVAILKDGMKAQIMRKGRAIVFDAELQKEPAKLIQALLDLRGKYARIVDVAFGGERMFALGMKEVRARARARARAAGGLRRSLRPAPPPSRPLPATPPGLRVGRQRAGGGPAIVGGQQRRARVPGAVRGRADEDGLPRHDRGRGGRAAGRGRAALPLPLGQGRL
jgi:cullin 3